MVLHHRKVPRIDTLMMNLGILIFWEWRYDKTWMTAHGTVHRQVTLATVSVKRQVNE